MLSFWVECRRQKKCEDKDDDDDDDDNDGVGSGCCGSDGR
jgi:hypothetical protein